MQEARPLFFILTYLLHSLAMCLPVYFPCTECQVIASLLPPKTSCAHHEDCRTSRQTSMLVASTCQVYLWQRYKLRWCKRGATTRSLQDLEADPLDIWTLDQVLPV